MKVIYGRRSEPESVVGKYLLEARELAPFGDAANIEVERPSYSCSMLVVLTMEGEG